MPLKEVFVEHIGAVTINRNRQSVRYKIAIRPDGRVTVTIPWLASFLSGEKFLIQHLQWVSDMRDKMAKKPAAQNSIQPGHLLSTRNYHYHVCSADIPQLRIRYAPEAKQVFFEYPANLPIESSELQNKLQVMIAHVLRFDARKYLPGRISELAKTHGYAYQKVTIKNNKTNWGSCSTLKNINLNLHLMRLSDRLIDYVIVHELVHTVIPNHGPHFKSRMKSYFPDMDELDKELKETGTAISSRLKMQ